MTNLLITLKQRHPKILASGTTDCATPNYTKAHKTSFVSSTVTMILHRSYKSFLTTQRNGAAAVAGPRLFFLLIVAVLFSGVQAQSTPPQSGASDAFSTSFEQSNDTNGISAVSSRAASAVAATKDILVSEFSVSNTMAFFCGKFLCPLCTFT